MESTRFTPNPLFVFLYGPAHGPSSDPAPRPARDRRADPVADRLETAAWLAPRIEPAPRSETIGRFPAAARLRAPAQLPAPSEQREAPETRLTALARRVFAEGVPSTAFEILEALPAQPRSPADLSFHAEVAASLGQFRRADTLYAEALMLEPLNPALHCARGELAGDVARALLASVREGPRPGEVAHLVEQALLLRDRIDLGLRLAKCPEEREAAGRSRRRAAPILAAVNEVLAAEDPAVVARAHRISKAEALRALSDPHAQPYSHLVDGRRFAYLPPNGPATLFRDGQRPHVRDDEQGKLGTCFLNSAWIATVNRRPNFVAGLYRDLGPDRERAGVHNYEVCVHIQKKRGYRTEPLWVAVDNLLVSDTRTGEPVFAQTLDSGRGRVLDMALYEKAFAKANDYARILRYDTPRAGFDSIDEGGLHEGFMAITGHIAATMDLAIGPEDVESGPKLRNHDVFGFMLDQLGSGEIAAYTDIKPTEYLTMSRKYDPVQKKVCFSDGSWADLSVPGSDPKKLRDDGMLVLHRRHGAPLVLMDDHAYAILGRAPDGSVVIRNPHASNPSPDGGPPAPGTFELSPEDLRAVGHQASWCRFPKTDQPPAYR